MLLQLFEAECGDSSVTVGSMRSGADRDAPVIRAAACVTDGQPLLQAAQRNQHWHGMAAPRASA